jgi:hypothetical protein
MASPMPVPEPVINALLFLREISSDSDVRLVLVFSFNGIKLQGLLKQNASTDLGI